jgi:hypothetical protein
MAPTWSAYNYVLVVGNPIGARLHKAAKAKGILLMG